MFACLEGLPYGSDLEKLVDNYSVLYLVCRVYSPEGESVLTGWECNVGRRGALAH